MKELSILVKKSELESGRLSDAVEAATNTLRSQGYEHLIIDQFTWAEDGLVEITFFNEPKLH